MELFGKTYAFGPGIAELEMRMEKVPGQGTLLLTNLIFRT